MMLLSIMADCRGTINAVFFPYHYIGRGSVFNVAILDT